MDFARISKKVGYYDMISNDVEVRICCCFNSCR